MSGELVLVTGGSGFIGSYCILHLTQAGYRVRTTVRSLRREADVRGMLARGGVEPGERLSFVEADLTADRGWSEAVSGCAYVLHVASPFPAGAPKNADDLIAPAREGTLRVLRAAHGAGVRRVVLTSSFAAIGYGNGVRGRRFTEADWTDPSAPGLTAYVMSKTLAERAAWDFVAGEGRGLELSVVNPVGVFGPLLGPDYSTSIQLVQRMLEGGVPFAPRLYFGVVDVRDVADLHIRAMTASAAAGERFLAVAGDFLSVAQIGRTLREKIGQAGARTPRWEAPDWLVRLLARVRPSAGVPVTELGRHRNGTNEKARRVLGWTPRPPADALVATAESLVRLGLLKSP